MSDLIGSKDIFGNLRMKGLHSKTRDTSDTRNINGGGIFVKLLIKVNIKVI